MVGDSVLVASVACWDSMGGKCSRAASSAIGRATYPWAGRYDQGQTS